MSIQAIPIISTQGIDMIIISTMAMTMDLAVTRTVAILAPVDIRAVVILAPVIIDMVDTRTVVMDSAGIRIGAIIKSLFRLRYLAIDYVTTATNGGRYEAFKYPPLGDTFLLSNISGMGLQVTCSTKLRCG
jgi:hypothetical protein